MRKLERELHNKAMEENISREILSFAKDSEANVYRFLIDIYEDGVKGIKSFFYMPAVLDEAESIRVMQSAVIEYYCGGDYDGTLQALILEASGNKEADVEVSEKADKPEVSEKADKPKARRTRKSAAKKSDEKPADKSEEKEDKPEEKPAKKSKTIAYDRSQEQHRKQLAKVLNTNFPDWAKDKELAAKAKQVSESLVGVAIFDSDGEVLNTFEQNVMELMGVSGEDESVDL